MTRIHIPLKSPAAAWLFAALFSALRIGCTHEPASQSVARPMTPIQMNDDTTTLYLSDFVGVLPSLDSLKCEMIGT